MDTYWETRINNIKSRVSMREIVDHFRVECQSDGIVTQIRCPFHGDDLHASARIYETNTMYCWKCNKVWDVISFVRDIQNLGDFNKACIYLEDAFGIARPDASIAYEQKETLKQFLDKQQEDLKKDKDFEQIFSKINDKLILNKESFIFPEYIKLFNFLDSTYALYKTDDYLDDRFIQNALETIQKEISKIV